MLSSPRTFPRGRISWRTRPPSGIGRLIAASSLLLLNALTACDPGTLNPDWTDPGKSAHSLLLNAATLNLVPGDTFRLQSTVLSRTGAVLGRSGSTQNPMPARGYPSFSWSSSDPAIVTVDGYGLAEGIGEGEAVITVSSGSTATFARAKVGRGSGKGKDRGGSEQESEQTPARVVLSPDSAVLPSPGSSAQFAATVLDVTNTVLDSSAVTWSSTHPELATVDGGGNVTAKAAGVSLIIAFAGSVSDTARVTVAPPATSESYPSRVVLTPDTVTLDSIGASLQLLAEVFDAAGGPLSPSSVSWSATRPEAASVDDTGRVRAEGEGVGLVIARSGTVADTARVVVRLSSGSSRDSAEIRVSGFDSKGLRAALEEVSRRGGGTIRFPGGTYDLRDWPNLGVRVDVPVILIAERDAILQGAGAMYLFDFGREVTVQGLVFRDWLRPIRFLRVADWSNDGVDARHVRVIGNQFEDVAIAIEGRRESGSVAPTNAHHLALLLVEGNTFLRTRRAVDFRRVLVDRFDFTHNTARDVVHRNPEPDVPLTITTLLQIGADLEDERMRHTQVYVQHNDIRNISNEDPVNGRAYAILAYRGPTIVEDNHIENVTAAEGSDDGAAAIYQRSRTYARFSRNRVVDATNTANIAAVFAKQAGAVWDVLDNEIIFSDRYKDLHGSPDYNAFEATHADIRFEGNVVRGASRLFVTRMDTGNYGRAKLPLVIRNNAFEDCAPRPNSIGRAFTLGYRRSVIEVTGNRFINCSLRGNEFIYTNSADNFAETDSLRITGNEWIYTSPLRVPEQVIRFNAYPRLTTITDNRITYPTGEAAAPVTLLMLPSAEGEAGARVNVADNYLAGFREGTAAAISIIDSRAALSELRVERNRVVSGGNFVRLSNTPPALTIVRDNDVTGIRGDLVRREADGGELVVSGNER